MAIALKNTKGKSPYVKHGKTPFRYSEAYQRWNKALGAAGIGYLSEEYNAADAAFRRAFHIPTGRTAR